MLQFTPLRVMKLRNIDKPHAFLRKNGFSNIMATRILRGSVVSVKLDQIERLCRVLRCQLPDLFTYVPDKSAPAPEHDTLAPLMRSPEPPGDINAILRDLPISRIEALTRELAMGAQPRA